MHRGTHVAQGNEEELVDNMAQLDVEVLVVRKAQGQAAKPQGTLACDRMISSGESTLVAVGIIVISSGSMTLSMLVTHI